MDPPVRDIIRTYRGLRVQCPSSISVIGALFLSLLSTSCTLFLFWYIRFLEIYIYCYSDDWVVFGRVTPYRRICLGDKRQVPRDRDELVSIWQKEAEILATASSMPSQALPSFKPHRYSYKNLELLCLHCHNVSEASQISITGTNISITYLQILSN